ncbi:MAG: hypothetical protein OIF40_09180 [Mangrovicoccus sp.]|nr:hypothetical protein [Mangrovicoccus sp.]
MTLTPQTVNYRHAANAPQLRDDLWARAFSLPGGATLEALLDWIEARP